MHDPERAASRGGASGEVLVLATGGTIATIRSAGGLGDVGLGGAELLRDLAQGDSRYRVTSRDHCAKASSELLLSDLVSLAKVVERSPAEGFTAVVITHGTDTLEETAYALSIMVTRRIPIVLTGAMRRPFDAGSDGPANLAAALRVSLSPHAAAIGPLVAFADEVHLASRVSKVHTSRTSAFDSPGYGPVAIVHEGNVLWNATPIGHDYLGLPEELPHRVEIIYGAVGMDGTLVESAVRSGADAIVIAGLGGGHVPPGMVAPIARAIDGGVPVVMSTRCASGPVLTSTYAGSGSETDLLSRGVISAGELPPVKARIRLLVGLGLGMSPQALFPG